MELVVGPGSLGPTECAWASSEALRSLPPLGPIRARRVIVVSPHPDDEVFGAGGFVQVVRTAGIPVEFVAVSDGEASHSGAGSPDADQLKAIRTRETLRALGRLGWQTPKVTRLGLPDGALAAHDAMLASRLGDILRPDDLCLAPWWHDGHPDHDACGRAARAAADAVGTRLLGYLVWAWHWCDPQGSDVPWERCRRFGFVRRTAARKRWATGAFVSQTRPFGPDRTTAPVVPATVLRRFWRPYEVFVEARPQQW